MSWAAFAGAATNALSGGTGGGAPAPAPISHSGSITVQPIGLNLGEILQQGAYPLQNGGNGGYFPNRLSSGGSALRQPTDSFKEISNTNFTPILIASGLGVGLILLLKRR